jgi:hypothetical protein
MAQSNINWAKLVREGRVKAPGISWSKEEADAVFKNKVPADIVRSGFLTVKAFDAAKKEAAKIPEKYAEKKLKLLKKADLIVLAKELKIDFDESVLTNNDLIAEIRAKAEKSEENATK